MTMVENDKVESIRRFVVPDQRIGLTDLARSKDWREALLVHEIVEVVDRTETAAYLVSPDGMRALMEKISALEEELEQAEIDALFSAREDMDDWSSGNVLASKAKDRLRASIEALGGISDAD